MSTQYSTGGETVEKASGQESHGAAATGSTGYASGAATAGGEESSSSGGAASGQNWGSARSDYGENAYGGSLDERGMGGKGYDDFSKGRNAGDDSNYGMPALRKATGGGDGVGVKRSRGGYGMEKGSTGLTLLAGMVMGATLMYLLDPQQGRRRRALLRDKIVGLSNDAADVLGKSSRDLRNRAQGVIAETTKAIGLRGGEGESDAGTDNSQSAGSTGNQQAGAASAASRQ